MPKPSETLYLDADEQVIDQYLRAIDPIATTDPAVLRELETRFVSAAARFSRRRGITRGAWLDAGVSEVILDQVGV